MALDGDLRQRLDELVEQQDVVRRRLAGHVGGLGRSGLERLAVSFDHPLDHHRVWIPDSGSRAVMPSRSAR